MLPTTHPPVAPKSPNLRIQAIGVTVFAVVVCCVLSIAYGKDLHWDLYNYHLYAPHALLHYSLDSDFMGAGWLRYINPVAALPFYLMVTADWPARLISVALASVHALNIVLVWWICKNSLFGAALAHRDWVALATVLACLTTVFLGLIGSSFTDPLTSIFLLSSLAVLMGASRSPDTTRPFLVAGLLAGLSVGLKLTNVVFAFAIGVSILATGQSVRTRMTCMTSFGVCCLVGILIANGWWAWQLYAEFGNPVFPLQNAIFRSPDFPPVSLHNERFVADGAISWLLLPFKMLQHKSWVYYEIAAPDWRFAFCVLAGLAFFALQIARRFGVRTTTLEGTSSPALVFFTFLATSYFLWVLTSTNARYALPLMLLIGPACVWLVFRMSRTNEAMGKLIVLVLIAAQAFVISEVGNPRWESSDWTRTWMEYQIPNRLKEEPFGYVTLGTNSNGALAPFLHRDSRFVNVTGLYVVNPSGAGAQRVRDFLQRHEGRLRMLSNYASPKSPKQSVASPVIFSSMEQQLAPWGLTINKADCEYIVNDSALTNTYGQTAGGIVSCAIVRSGKSTTVMDAERRVSDLAFDYLERTCPKLFRPAGVFSTKEGRMWKRRYFDTDIVLYTLKGRVAYSRYDHGPWDVDLGTESELANAGGKVNCDAK